MVRGPGSRGHRGNNIWERAPGTLGLLHHLTRQRIPREAEDASVDVGLQRGACRKVLFGAQGPEPPDPHQTQHRTGTSNERSEGVVLWRAGGWEWGGGLPGHRCSPWSRDFQTGRTGHERTPTTGPPPGR
jgi:hypothetical protein